MSSTTWPTESGSAGARGDAVADVMTPLCIDVPAAARWLGVGTSSIRRWVESGELAVVKFPSEKHAGERSRRVLIAVADLKAFVAKHRVEVAQ